MGKPIEDDWCVRREFKLWVDISASFTILGGLFPLVETLENMAVGWMPV